VVNNELNIKLPPSQISEVFIRLKFPLLPLELELGMYFLHKVLLELELIQAQMAQKPVLRGEVGARALRVRSVSREEV